MQLLREIKDKILPKDKEVGFREVSRAVLFNEDNLIPILFVSKENYHKIPGGGIEKGEDQIKACHREMLEETGCEMEVTDEVGKIEEYRSEFNLTQISYCYLGIETLKNDKPQNYEGSFIQKRDLTFLERAKELVLKSGK